MVLNTKDDNVRIAMRTDTPQRLVPYVAPIGLLALAVVLPPKYLAACFLVLGLFGFGWALLYRRDVIFKPSVLTITIPLALAAFFCLLGTLPVTQKSDIQLEFLKYAIYAAAFLLGLLALGQEWKRRAFIISIVVVIYAFFIATALTSAQNFGINQAWLLYPPDQNNSCALLAPLAAFVLAFRPRWLKIAMLLLLFLFFTFAESRLGLILLFAVLVVEMFLDWRSGLIVLIAAGVISAAFSLSDVGAQTTILRLAPQITTSSSAQGATEEPFVSTNRMMEFGTSSDSSRLNIYKRALEVGTAVFPNLLGLGDQEVTTRLNTPRLDQYNTFQHAHNFFLQGYLAYGLLATFFLVVAAIAMVVLAIRQRDWYLPGTLAMIGAFGMIEALISDLRVLTILMVVLGSSVAICLQTGKNGEP